MDKLLLGIFIKEIKKLFSERISNTDIIEMLYDSVNGGNVLLNKNDEPINVKKSDASNIINLNLNPLSIVVEYSKKEEAYTNAIRYFNKNILPRLHKNKEEYAITIFTQLVDNDSGIIESDRKRLKKNASVDKLANFLVDIYFYTLTVSNKIKEYSENVYHHTTNEKRYPLSGSIIQNNYPINDSLPYISAIIEAYRDHDGSDFTEDELVVKHKKHYDRQKESFYAADMVKRFSRDAYSNDEIAPFDILMSEIYDGVIETWEEGYEDGLKRMNVVVAEATKIHSDASILCKETNWITTKVKKGTCHMLVNDERLKGWIIND